MSRPELLLDDGGVTFRQFLNDLLSLARHIDAGRRAFAALMELTPSQYSMVMLVADATPDGGIAPREVARRLQQQDTFVIAQLRKLLTDGLLASAPNPADRRSILYMLTEHGEALLERVRPLVQLSNDAFFDGMDDSEFRTVAAVLRHLAANSEQSLKRAEALAAADDLLPPEHASAPDSAK